MEQARTVLEQTRALIPEFEEGQREANNRLCVLLGLPPAGPDRRGIGRRGYPADAAGSRRRDTSGLSPSPSGCPQGGTRSGGSDLHGSALRKRNSIHRFRLPAHWVGRQELSKPVCAGDLFEGGVGPGFNWNILNYGRIVNGGRAQDAKFQQAVYAYQEKVLEAGQRSGEWDSISDEPPTLDDAWMRRHSGREYTKSSR